MCGLCTSNSKSKVDSVERSDYIVENNLITKLEKGYLSIQQVNDHLDDGNCVDLTETEIEKARKVFITNFMNQSFSANAIDQKLSDNGFEDRLTGEERQKITGPSVSKGDFLKLNWNLESLVKQKKVKVKNQSGQTVGSNILNVQSEAKTINEINDLLRSKGYAVLTNTEISTARTTYKATLLNNEYSVSKIDVEFKRIGFSQLEGSEKDEINPHHEAEDLFHKTIQKYIGLREAQLDREIDEINQLLMDHTDEQKPEVKLNKEQFKANQNNLTNKRKLRGDKAELNRIVLLESYGSMKEDVIEKLEDKAERYFEYLEQ